jgi:hypothetical protein
MAVGWQAQWITSIAKRALFPKNNNQAVRDF